MEVTFAVRHIGVEHLGIMTLVAALKRAGHSARVVPAKIRAVERCLEGVQGPRLLALSAPTLDLEHYLALARRVCTRRPGTRIILGGPHPTFAPEVIREDGVEMICRGEGEGAKTRIMVNRYERSASARQACLNAHGTACTVCGFDFGERYGDLGEGFIHVHHLVDLSTIGKEYEIDGAEDLRPVCPNCHAMLHRERPALTLDNLSKQLN